MPAEQTPQQKQLLAMSALMARGLEAVREGKDDEVHSIAAQFQDIKSASNEKGTNEKDWEVSDKAEEYLKQLGEAIENKSNM